MRGARWHARGLMQRRIGWIAAAIVYAALCPALAWWALRPAPGAPLAETPTPRPASRAASEARVRPRPSHVGWIASSGGPSPDANEVSLEDDLRELVAVLGEDGVVLFAGGPGTRAVQVEDDPERGDVLRSRLGTMFAPRDGRDARYRETSLELNGPATLERFAGELESALAESGDPLDVWLGGHGAGGETPIDAQVFFWGGEVLDPITLAEWLDEGHARPVRLVITTCFSGGFAELAFTGADPARGAAASDRCAVMATAWDEESSGCDPSPERAAQDGFTRHLLAALAGRELDGREARGEIDLDGDGEIGLLEALAHVRVRSRAVDVPTTTSDRLLDALAPREGPRAPVELREERRVIAELTEALGLTRAEDVRARLDEVRGRLAGVRAAMDEEQGEADSRWATLSGVMLSRWPVLDDPYHPDWEETVASEREDILTFMDTASETQAWLAAEDEVEALASSELSLRIEASVLRRLDDALEVVERAERLRAADAEGFARWERVRACEARRL